MRRSSDRILTTHVGSLPAPPDLWSLEGVDWQEFSKFYQAAVAGGTLFEQTRSAAPQSRAGAMDWACTGPVTYRGQADLQREIDTLRTAIGTTAASDAFLTSTAPASLEPSRANRHYSSGSALLH